MLFPYSQTTSPRAPCGGDRWVGSDWRLLERHEIQIQVPPDVAVDALAATPLRDLPAVVALFTLCGLRFSKEMTLRDFFSAPPFVLLEEEAGREMVFGVLVPPAGGERRRRRPDSPAEFRSALDATPFAAIGIFRAEPEASGTRLWTETWAKTKGAGPGLLFGAYWLAIGPWSAWIRRMFLAAARARAERGARRPG